MGKLRNGSSLAYLEHISQICCASWSAQDLEVWLLLHASFLAHLKLHYSRHFNLWPVLGSSILQTIKYIACCAECRMGKETEVSAVPLLNGVSPMTPCPMHLKAVLLHEWTCLQYTAPSFLPTHAFHVPCNSALEDRALQSSRMSIPEQLLDAGLPQVLCISTASHLSHCM